MTTPAIFTIGHSNQPQPVLIEALLANQIEVLVDVRFYPASRRNPQFNREALASALRAQGIEYRHAIGLGGRRKPAPHSTNAGLTNEGFRGFADYMQTSSFDRALQELLETASSKRVALMCAESVPWKCHRSLIADAITARGLVVEHIVGGRLQPHRLSPVARIEDARVTYPGLLQAPFVSLTSRPPGSERL